MKPQPSTKTQTMTQTKTVTKTNTKTPPPPDDNNPPPVKTHPSNSDQQTLPQPTGVSGSPPVVAWKQGKLDGLPVIKVVHADGSMKTYLGKHPPKVMLLSGKDSANRTVKVISGNAPKTKQVVKIGFENVEIIPTGNKKEVKLKFTNNNEGQIVGKEYPMGAGVVRGHVILNGRREWRQHIKVDDL